jgi:hypothetical protein
MKLKKIKMKKENKKKNKGLSWIKKEKRRTVKLNNDSQSFVILSRYIISRI